MPDHGDPPRPRKDRLIQTRVERDLEATLKQEAQRRRLTVSHLIRSVLEDTFHLVDGVVADVDEIVGGSARLARNVRRNARRLASPARDRPEPGERSAPPGSEFPHVRGWNELVLNRPTSCSGCGAGLARGERGFLGVCDDPGAPRDTLCPACVESL